MKNETVNTLQNKGLESPTALNVNLDNDIITAEKDKNKKDLKSFVCMEIVNKIKLVIQYTTLIGGVLGDGFTITSSCAHRPNTTRHKKPPERPKVRVLLPANGLFWCC